MMPTMAPSAAPDETPRRSGETGGLRNMYWYVAPAADSAPPTSTAATALGRRISRSTVSAVGEIPRGSTAACPPSWLTKKAATSRGLMGKCPTDRAASASAPSAAADPTRWAGFAGNYGMTCKLARCQVRLS